MSILGFAVVSPGLSVPLIPRAQGLESPDDSPDKAPYLHHFYRLRACRISRLWLNGRLTIPAWGVIYHRSPLTGVKD